MAGSDTPTPLEEQDPEFGDLLVRFFRRADKVKFFARWIIDKHADALLQAGRDALRQQDRNAPCPCGTGRKFKKCCGAC